MASLRTKNLAQIRDGAFTADAAGRAKFATDFVNASLLDETDTYDFSSGVLRAAVAVSASDVVVKSQLDSAINGLDWKDSVRLATTAALAANTPAGSGVGKTLTADANGALSVDGQAVSVNDRILVKDEGAGTSIHNGIYTVTQVGDGSNPWILTRATDADEDAEVTANLAVFVGEGSANADNAYTLVTNDPITVDTTAQTYTQFNGAGSITAGAGLSKTGNTINVNATDTSITVGADDIAVNLATNPGLEVSSGLKIDAADDSLTLAASGVSVQLHSTGGLETVAANGLRVRVDGTRMELNGSNQVDFTGDLAGKSLTDSTQATTITSATGFGVSITSASNQDINFNPGGTGNVIVDDTLLRIGEDADVDLFIQARNGDANEPAIKYNSASNQWEIANDGVTFSAIATAAAAFDGNLAGSSLRDETQDTTIIADISPTARDIILRMSDAAGSQKVSFQDSSPAEVARIDSNGNLTFVAASIIGTDAGNLTVDAASNLVLGGASASEVQVGKPLQINAASLIDIVERAAPSASASGEMREYFDSTSKTWKVSQNAGSYENVVKVTGDGLTGTDTFTVQAADSTITVAVGGVSVGSIDTANLDNNAVTFAKLSTALQGRLGYTRKEEFNGDNSTTAFDLAVTDADLANAAGTLVYLNGSLMKNSGTGSTNYTTSDGTGAGGVDQIVFNSAPSSDDEITVVYRRTGATA